MGIADRVGALLPGQEADFVLLDSAQRRCSPAAAPAPRCTTGCSRCRSSATTGRRRHLLAAVAPGFHQASKAACCRSCAYHLCLAEHSLRASELIPGFAGAFGGSGFDDAWRGAVRATIVPANPRREAVAAVGWA